MAGSDVMIELRGIVWTLVIGISKYPIKLQFIAPDERVQHKPP